MNLPSFLYVFEASAGAGKTFALVTRYLSIILSRQAGYRSVLAVTFTNKATAEIKERILRILYGLTLLGNPSGSSDPAAKQAAAYLPDLKKALNGSGDEVIKRAREVLRDLLFDYSFFSVYTIDSFFQRVMREFARETGLPFGYVIELDNRQAVAESVDRMLEESRPGEPLFRFLVDFVDRYSEEGKWDIRTKLIREGSQVFSENFLVPGSSNPLELISKFQQELYKIIKSYETRIKELGKTGMEILEKYGMVPEDFSYKKSSVPSMFPKMMEGNLHHTSYFIRALDDPENILPKSDRNDTEKQHLVHHELLPLFREIAQYYTTHFPAYAAATSLVSTLHVYGVQIMLREYIHRWIREENRFLIAEVNRFLKGIIGNNELPFIYEKIGQHFRYYLLDEFQDTSHFQYHNLRPLLKDSLARGDDLMLVGDIKQSIFRWRNSDWAIMVKEVPKDFLPEQIKSVPLKKNYRSRENIVRFNNAFFRIAPEVLMEAYINKIREMNKQRPLMAIDDVSEYTELIRTAYSFDKLRQDLPDNKDVSGGYVYFRFFSKKDHDNWQDAASAAVCEKVDSLIRDGYEPGQIALLVRKNEEGARMVRDLIAWQQEHPDSPRFSVISDEALDLDQSVAVRLVIEWLQLMQQPDDLLIFSRFYYTVLRPVIPVDAKPRPLTDASAAGMTGRERWKYFLSGLDEIFFDRLGGLPLTEIIREVIRYFGLGKLSGEVPFLYALENKALDHTLQGGTGISSFLNWWEEQGKDEKIPMPEGLNAVRVMTIYKAKGLGMDVVILPFADWAFEITGGNNPDILWCHSDRKPFDMMRDIPVVSKNLLLHSLFSKEYLHEKVSRYIDNLNLVYVSLTRAISQMYVFACSDKGTATTGTFIYNVMEKLKEERDDDVLKMRDVHTQEQDVAEFGSYEPPGEKRVTPVPETVGEFPVTPVLHRVRFLPRGRKYFLLKKTGQTEKIDRGNLFHELLAGIYTSADIEPVVRRTVREGMIPVNEEQQYVERLRKIIRDPEAAGWFSGTWEVLNEMPLIRPDGAFLRPDRVMVRDKEVVVVDYKFGEKEEPGYRSQVKRYMKSLSGMGYVPVTGVIWYVTLEKKEFIHPEKKENDGRKNISLG
ncbi:MAG: UvrD-helicase domain-containing protein [Chlorobi bacterium]|nr:UvrD-helicase domain-containing protein [Chlorobiota bacterium]